MRVSAKADYALRAVIELAVIGSDGPVKGERVAQAQEIPLKFLENILGDLRHAGIVRSQRGVDGGYWLARPADEITVAEVIRGVEGPIANVRGVGPEQVEYAGSAERLRDVWIAVRANLRAVLEQVTIADLANGDLPTLTARVQDDLRTLLGAKGEPTFRAFHLWPKAIPQYDLTYSRFKDIMDEAERRNPGLALAGSYREGVALTEAIGSGEEAAVRLATTVPEAGAAPT